MRDIVLFCSVGPVYCQEDKTMQFVESMRFHFTQLPDDIERDVSRPEELKELIMRRVDTAESSGQTVRTAFALLLRHLTTTLYCSTISPPCSTAPPSHHLFSLSSSSTMIIILSHHLFYSLDIA